MAPVEKLAQGQVGKKGYNPDLAKRCKALPKTVRETSAACPQESKAEKYQLMKLEMHLVLLSRSRIPSSRLVCIREGTICIGTQARVIATQMLPW